MSKRCSKCGTPAQDYHQFCLNPACEEDFPLKQPTSGGDPQKDSTLDIPAKVPPITRKPARVNKTNLSREPFHLDPDPLNHLKHGAVPATDADLMAPVACGHCGRVVWPDMTTCCYCGARFESSETVDAQAPADGQPVDIVFAGERELPDRKGRAGQWDRSVPPLMIYHNAAKLFFEGRMNVVHLRIFNPFSHVIEHLGISIKGSTLEKPLEGMAPGCINAGQTLSIRMADVLPTHCGEDVFDVAIGGILVGGEAFHLKGMIPVRIEPVQRGPSHIEYNIAAPDVGDHTVNIANRHTEPDNATLSAADEWIPIELFFDRRRQAQQNRYFPRGAAHPEVRRIDPEIVQAMRSISPEAAPVSALSTQDGRIYFIIAGHTLVMGRDAQSNHVCLSIYPEKGQEYRNRTISRTHSRLFIRDKRVYIRDMSKTGILIDGKRIARQQNVMLPSGEILLFQNLLELEIRIVTDGTDVMAVLVKRLNNNSHHVYVLAHGPLPVGYGQDLSIGGNATNNILGVLYYRPATRSWCFRQCGPSTIESGEKTLDAFQSIASGQHRLWFSPVR
jgi:pSer/pThr/pTyr-binding forkhead associated (FHA) protein